MSGVSKARRDCLSCQKIITEVVKGNARTPANRGWGQYLREGASERAVARPQTPFDGWLIVGAHVVPRLKPGLGQHCAEAHGAKRRCRAGVSFRMVQRPSPGFRLGRLQPRSCQAVRPAPIARTPRAPRRRETPERR